MSWTRYVALGDSLTEGLADLWPDGRPRGWADRLAQHLADHQDVEVGYANLAIRGRLLGPILAEQLEPALALEPDLVSLWGGGNDLLRPNADPVALAAHLETAMARIRATGADVLVGLSGDPRGAPVLALTRERCAVYDLAIWAAARRHGAHVLDVWHLRTLQDWRRWDADRLHMNADGHALVALEALTTLGFAPEDPAWAAPLPPAPRPGRAQRVREEYAWTRDHLAPWVGRRLRRTSSGAGRTPKYPDYVTIAPGSSGESVAQRAE